MMRWTWLGIGAALFGLMGLPSLCLGEAAPTPGHHIVINIPSRTLWLFEGEKVVKKYPVGLGRKGYMTPVGEYTILNKVKHPTWENPYKPPGTSRIKPGRNNPLGTRWMSFKEVSNGEYGIHGTNNPASVGKFSSHGCVRMRIADAEELYDKVDIGTPVDVVYHTAIVERTGPDIKVVSYPDSFGKGKTSPEKIKEIILSEYPQARIDGILLHKTLKKPSQKPVVVGKIPDAPYPPVPPLPEIGNEE